MSEIVKSVVDPKTCRVELYGRENGAICMDMYLGNSRIGSIKLHPTELSDALWREVFKANPEITTALAEAKGKSIENLVMLAHCAGLDVTADIDKWGASQKYKHSMVSLWDFEREYEKITVSLPEPESLGPLTKAHLKISTAQLEKIDVLTRENEALKAALATVQAAVGDVLSKQETQ